MISAGNIMERRISDRKGFIALVSVLILGAVLLAVSIGLSLRGTSESVVALGEELSMRALMLAEGCAEHAVLRLVGDLNYSGNETIIVEGSDACSVLPLLGSGNLSRTIRTEAFVKGYKRRIEVSIAEVSPLTFSSWREVAAF